MAWTRPRLGRRLGGRRAGVPRSANSADLAHLQQFISTRSGVEGYLEPRTTVTEPTVVLVAGTGEWTRRRVPAAEVRTLGKKLAIPVYDVAATGYPQRMREWTAMRKAAGDTGVPGLDGPSA